MKKTKKLLAGLTISALAFSNMLSANFALASDNLSGLDRNFCNILNKNSLRDLNNFLMNNGNFYYYVDNENPQKISLNYYKKYSKNF